MISNQYKDLGIFQWTNAHWQSDLRGFINNTNIKCPPGESKLESNAKLMSIYPQESVNNCTNTSGQQCLIEQIDKQQIIPSSKATAI